MQEVRLDLLTTHFMQFRITSFFWETKCTLIFETLENCYVHKQLYYILHKR